MTSARSNNTAATGLGTAVVCGDKTRTQKQVCEIFNTKYPDRRISQSTRKSEGYIGKKSKTFSPEEIRTFIDEAPDNQFL
ncbi:hypothetical protein NQ318_014326 [Aromia moschata]|uniref:Uncharacterized protein n=1 Tax=Aromia moschata TaxID=1265417 RepID=A0AAV8YZB6_9CUCU|nr:hypothetical protein NQ318_014326 [Aromia moschata]